MSIDPTERLRVDVPTLEPDPALLSRLVAASATAPMPSRAALPRVLLAAASVAVIAVTAWGISQLPDGGSPPPSPVQSPGRGQVTPTPSRGHGGGTTADHGASTEPDANAPTSTASGTSPGHGLGPSGTGPGDSGEPPAATGGSGTTGSGISGSGQGQRGHGHRRPSANPGKHKGQNMPHPNHRSKAGGDNGAAKQSRKPSRVAPSERRVATGQELSQKNTS